MRTKVLVSPSPLSLLRTKFNWKNENVRWAIVKGAIATSQLGGHSAMCVVLTVHSGVKGPFVVHAQRGAVRSGDSEHSEQKSGNLMRFRFKSQVLRMVSQYLTELLE